MMRRVRQTNHNNASFLPVTSSLLLLYRNPLLSHYNKHRRSNVPNFHPVLLMWAISLENINYLFVPQVDATRRPATSTSCMFCAARYSRRNLLPIHSRSRKGHLETAYFNSIPALVGGWHHAHGKTFRSVADKVGSTPLRRHRASVLLQWRVPLLSLFKMMDPEDI